LQLARVARDRIASNLPGCTTTLIRAQMLANRKSWTTPQNTANPEGLPLALQGVALQVCAAINSQNTISELCRAKLFLCDDGLVRPQDGAREEQKMEEMNIDSGHALSDATRKFYITAITTEFQFWIQNYTRVFC
jgi:hypothetical protein